MVSGPDAVGKVASGNLDLRRLRGFALDEYVGLPPNDRRP